MDKSTGPDIYLCFPEWKSSADYSRPQGDKPTEGDYIIRNRPHAVFRIKDVKHDRDGWNLLCEQVSQFWPWKNDPPTVRVFDFEWRTA